MLVADVISHSRMGRPFFKGLGFCLLYGSLTVILGKSEAAKDALLHMLAGNIKPKRGQIRFEGQPVLNHAEYQNLVTHIGTKNELMPRLTVEENIRRFIFSSHSDELLEAALRYFSLTPYARQACGILPLHMQRRVTYARLLAAPSALWLLNHKAEQLDQEGNDLLYMLVSNRCNQDGIVVMTGSNADFISPNLPLNLDDFD